MFFEEKFKPTRLPYPVSFYISPKEFIEVQVKFNEAERRLWESYQKIKRHSF